MSDAEQKSVKKKKIKEQLRYAITYAITAGCGLLLFKPNFDLTDRINLVAVWVLFGVATTWVWLRYLTKKIEEIESILKKDNSQDVPEKKDDNLGDTYEL